MSGTNKIELVDHKISSLNISYDTEYDYEENDAQKVELILTPTFYSDDENSNAILLVIHLKIFSESEQESSKAIELDLEFEYNFYYQLVNSDAETFFNRSENEVDLVESAYPYITAYVSTLTALSGIRTFRLPPFVRENINHLD